MTDLDRSVTQDMAVAPDDADANPATDPRQQAGQDRSIARRLEKNPGSEDAQLDNALDESMDASDPPANTQPGHGEPAPSSGFDAEAESER